MKQDQTATGLKTLSQKNNLSFDTDPNVKSADDCLVHTWFVRLFFLIMIVTVLAIWLIPNEVLLRWSMWWNNIPIN
jgi:hypothetical protein